MNEQDQGKTPSPSCGPGPQVERTLAGAGTLFRGEDGSVYYVPFDKLAAFQVAPEVAKSVTKALGDVDHAKTFSEMNAADGRALGVPANGHAIISIVQLEAFRKRA